MPGSQPAGTALSVHKKYLFRKNTGKTYRFAVEVQPYFPAKTEERTDICKRSAYTEPLKNARKQQESKRKMRRFRTASHLKLE